MTYVTLDIFERFLRATGIVDKAEYHELYKRKLIPTKLLPRVPSVYYKSHGIYVKRGTHIKTFEKKYGRKYNNQNKEDTRLLKIITKATPEARAGKSEWNRKPEVIARKKEYMKVRQQTPEFKARTKAYRRTPGYISKKKVYSTTYYDRPEVRARYSAYAKEYNQRPEVKARKKRQQRVYRQRQKQ